MSDLIINDETFNDLKDVLFPAEHSRGLTLESRPNPGGLCYGSTAVVPFDPKWLVPRSEWRARIEERKKLRRTLRDKIQRAGLPSKNQGSTNFCWANAPVAAMEMMRVLQNQEKVSLSPASVACPINGFVNEGGWGQQALKRIVEAGVVPTSLWPDNAINRKYATQANYEIGYRYRCLRWCELEPGNMDQMVSVLLRDIPVPIGLSWWGHEVTAVDPDWIDGDIALSIRNSWGQWGTQGNPGFEGYGVLQGRKMLADDAVCPFATTAV